MKLDCKYCGVDGSNFSHKEQNTFEWRCPACMRKFTHIGEEPKPKFEKRVVKVEKVKAVKEVEFKQYFELSEDKDA